MRRRATRASSSLSTSALPWWSSACGLRTSSLRTWSPLFLLELWRRMDVGRTISGPEGRRDGRVVGQAHCKLALGDLAPLRRPCRGRLGDLQPADEQVVEQPFRRRTEPVAVGELLERVRLLGSEVEVGDGRKRKRRAASREREGT